jgi:GINS complex subunit 3
MLHTTDDAKKLPCTFEFNGPGLGFLDGNVGEDVRENSSTPTVIAYASLQIKPGSRVDIPLWLGSFLAVPYVHHLIMLSDA